MRDFTLTMYRDLIGSRLPQDIFTVRDFIKNPQKQGLILRHDVDICPKKALRMAQIDTDLGVNSTYYFRYPKTFEPEILQKIAAMGHEVGYHYEVLDKTQGNFHEAIQLFKEELELFRKYVDVKTVSMHGGVLTQYDNRDIWKKYNLSDFGIIGEPYLSLNYDDIHYVSDTGRNWSGKYSVKDSVETPSLYAKSIKTTNDLINILKKNKTKVFFITIHPKRWSLTYTEWTLELVTQSVKNIAKSLKKNKRLK